jgi:hypothetical protein
MNGAVVMRLPPLVDLAVENRKLGGQLLVQVKHGCNRVRLSETCEKVLSDRIIVPCPVGIKRVLRIKVLEIYEAITAAIVVFTVKLVFV